MLAEIIAEVIKIVGIAVSTLVIRWMLDISTPRQDWRLVSDTVSWAYDSVRIPDWREFFNMERLEALRERIAWERKHWSHQYHASTADEYRPTSVVTGSVVTTATPAGGDGDDGRSEHDGRR